VNPAEHYSHETGFFTFSYASSQVDLPVSPQAYLVHRQIPAPLCILWLIYEFQPQIIFFFALIKLQNPITASGKIATLLYELYLLYIIRCIKV
jgi:hypothetical protein